MKRASLLLMTLVLSGEVPAHADELGARADLQVGGVLRLEEALDPSELDGWSDGMGTRREIEPSGGTALRTDALLLRDSHALGVGLMRDGQEREVGYLVTRSLSIGFDYLFLEAEDLSEELAVAGVLHEDWDSHHVIVRARWHFD